MGGLKHSEQMAMISPCLKRIYLFLHHSILTFKQGMAKTLLAMGIAHFFYQIIALHIPISELRQHFGISNIPTCILNSWTLLLTHPYLPIMKVCFSARLEHFNI